MKQNKTSVTSTGRWNVTKRAGFETGARAHVALRNGTKHTRQLLQRGHGLLRNGHGSKLCATHVPVSLIVVDGAADDVHSSSIGNVDASSL